jgi:hypothetical protein
MGDAHEHSGHRFMGVSAPDRQGKGGAEMQHENASRSRSREESRKKPGLLARARARTEQEHGLSLSADTAHYTAAALGQPPYVALGNGGVIVVQRRCGGWNC